MEDQARKELKTTKDKILHKFWGAILKAQQEKDAKKKRYFYEKAFYFQSKYERLDKEEEQGV
jgi:hypothetical protein